MTQGDGKLRNPLPGGGFEDVDQMTGRTDAAGIVRPDSDETAELRFKLSSSHTIANEVTFVAGTASTTYAPLTVNPPSDGDFDGDGLTDAEEADLGTNPNDPDTDGDGLTDKEEIELGTDPKNPDSNGNGVSDGEDRANQAPDIFVRQVILEASPPQELGGDPNGDNDGESTWEDGAIELHHDPGSQGGGTPVTGSTVEEIAASLHAEPFGQEWREDSGDALESSSTLQAVTPDPSHPGFDGEANKVEVRLQTSDGTKATRAMSRSFIKVTQLPASTASTLPEGEAVQHEVVTLTIPKDAKESSTSVTLEAMITNEDSGSVRLLPVELTWEAIGDNDNIEENTDPFTDEANGRKIFPGASTPDGNRLNKVNLAISGGIPGLRLYLKAFDIDDPTPHDFDEFLGENNIIDRNDGNNKSIGNDNLPDLLETPKDGYFSLTGSSDADLEFDEDGKIDLEFIVGMQPGNNYRVVAALDSAAVNACQVSNPDADGYVPSDEKSESPGELFMSKPLTVWRKLWVENDSLGEIPEYRPFPDFVRSGTDYEIVSDSVVTMDQNATTSNKPYFYRAGYLKNGDDHAKILDSEHELYTYYSDQFHETIPTNRDNFTLQNSEGFSGNQISLADDDDRGLPSAFTNGDIKDYEAWPRLNLPMLGLVNDYVKSRFRNAFIEVEEVPAAWNTTKVLPFDANKSGNWFATYWFGYADGLADAKNVQDKMEFWAQTVVAAYQGPSADDGDPFGEEVTRGFNLLKGGDQPIVAAIFVEGIREGLGASATINPEFFKKDLDNVVSHEIAHSPPNNLPHKIDEDWNADGTVDDHDELELMNIGAVAGDEFSAYTIARIRSPRGGWTKDE